MLGCAITALPDVAQAEMVRATGRAALMAGGDDVARHRALEDALYLAAIEGGVDVDGFSVVESGVLTGESIMLRASSRILDFAVIHEMRGGTHYEVTVEAYVAAQPKLGCAARPDLVLMAVQPQISASAKTPLWMADALRMAHERTLEMLSSAKGIKISLSDISLGVAAPSPSLVPSGCSSQSPS